MYSEQQWAIVLDAIGDGASIAEACKTIGCTQRTLEFKRDRDPAFRERYEEIRMAQVRKVDELAYKKVIKILRSDECFGHDLVKFWYQRMGAMPGAEVNVVNNGILAVGNVQIDTRAELDRLAAEENRLAALLADRAVQN